MTTILNFTPPIIAHRGASAYAPENTMTAFYKALQIGVQWLEFDVTLSKDNIPIVFHDKYLKRITGEAGRPCDYYFAELQNMDAGQWFAQRYASERIMSLERMLLFLKEYNLAANIELKQMPGKEDRVVETVLGAVNNFFPEPCERILFSSFSLKMLKSFRQFSSAHYLGLLLQKWNPHWLDWVNELNCVAVHVNQAILNEQRIAAIKQHDKLLLTYTVNEAGLARQLLSQEVDAIFSDFPDLLSS